MILIQCPCTGDRCLVESADGYEGWTVLCDDAPLPTADHCVWCCDDNEWKPDALAQARAEKLAAMRDPEALLAIIDDLTARIAALETASD